MEKHEFRAEAKQLLDLMIHSVYSNREIFLRELISNASDALDKLRVQALHDKELAPLAEDLHIRIAADEQAQTITVSDNGIGMNRDEVIEYIGTIAKSGTKDFLELLKQSKEQPLSPELIGQFGVGFYSSFMVADRITLVTRRAGGGQPVKWESSGDGSYTLDEVEKDSVGTAVTLHLKQDEQDQELKDYTAEWKIRQIVRQYSDYVAYPIRMKTEQTEYEYDSEGKVREDAPPKKMIVDDVLNSMQAIWLRPEKDVSDEEFNEFYKHISHDWNAPLTRVSLKAEGTFEYRALLFIPSKAPFDLFYRGVNRGIQLYIKRVFIMNDCEELIPEYLRFVKGIVDAEDLSLNISREILQQNKQIRMIRNRLSTKMLSTFKELLEKEKDKYLEFWREFGRVLKEGIYLDFEHREKILEVALFDSTDSSERKTTLDDYAARMKMDQDKIYFLTGESRRAIEHSPHLEKFREQNYEVLLLSDPVDEVWTQQALDYKGKPLQSVGKGEVELGSAEERKQEEQRLEEKKNQYQTLLEFLRGQLDEHIKEARVSTRLTASPVCLAGAESDLTPQLETMMRAMGQDVPKIKRILEINPTHPIIEKLQARLTLTPEDPALKQYAQILYAQALLAEGHQPPDPGEFSRKVAELMLRALG